MNHFPETTAALRRLARATNLVLRVVIGHMEFGAQLWLAKTQWQPASPRGETTAWKTMKLPIDSITVEKWTMVANTN